MMDGVSEQRGESRLSSRSGEPLMVRPLAVADVTQIVPIERRAYSHPNSEQTLASLIKRYGGSLLLRNQQALGFVIISRVLDESELIDIAIEPAEQGKGLGELLLQHAIGQLPSSVQGMFLEVRESNHSAIALYEKLGFIETGIRRGYYPAAKGREDAILMALDMAVYG